MTPLELAKLLYKSDLEALTYAKDLGNFVPVFPTWKKLPREWKALRIDQAKKLLKRLEITRKAEVQP